MVQFAKVQTFWGEKEFECTKCKAIFNFSFSMFLAFLCLFGENDTLRFTY
jgi:hypothetical protein